MSYILFHNSQGSCVFKPKSTTHVIFNGTLGVNNMEVGRENVSDKIDTSSIIFKGPQEQCVSDPDNIFTKDGNKIYKVSDKEDLLHSAIDVMIRHTSSKKS